jgi:hypothetical protein
VDFEIGQRVVVTGGYDVDPPWLSGGGGYAGTIVDIAGRRAVVELDDEIEVHARRQPWKDFGEGGVAQPTEKPVAWGQWLVLSLVYEGTRPRWEDPILRISVGLCPARPDLRSSSERSDVGALVESHATMRHARPAPPW